MIGDFNEKTKTLIELIREADADFLKALNDRAFEPDSELAHRIEDEGDVHAAMGRDKSTKEEFQKVRFGREWPQEKWYKHKGIPKWHPEEKNTMGIQKPKPSDVKRFFMDDHSGQ